VVGRSAAKRPERKKLWTSITFHWDKLFKLGKVRSVHLLLESETENFRGKILFRQKVMHKKMVLKSDFCAYLGAGFFNSEFCLAVKLSSVRCI
jgi:hypothetical protein